MDDTKERLKLLADDLDKFQYGFMEPDARDCIAFLIRLAEIVRDHESLLRMAVVHVEPD